MDEKTIKISPSELRDIMKEYEYNPDIMTTDDDRVLKTKKALSQIPMPDRIIFCCYLDMGSSRKLSKVLGVSHSTVLKEINRIKQEIRYIIVGYE